MHKICGTLPKNQEEQEYVVLRKGATKACSFEEVIIYSHYIGVTNGFSELNSSVKQRKIVQTESRMDLFIMPRCSRFKTCDKLQSDARQVKITSSPVASRREFFTLSSKTFTSLS